LAPPPPPAKAEVTATIAGEDDGAEASAEDLRRSKSSPLVRKIAAEHGVDITKLEGTGLSGRVTKNDILSFIESRVGAVVQPGSVEVPAAPATTVQTPSAVPPPLKPAAGDRVEQMSVMRKKIAEHMVLSRRTSAHVTTVYDRHDSSRQTPRRAS
jgi:2-oxoglutarate dehydrogenase E2 component (dihydrolipoamide succinyltransferase)